MILCAQINMIQRFFNVSPGLGLLHEPGGEKPLSGKLIAAPTPWQKGNVLCFLFDISFFLVGYTLLACLGKLEYEQDELVLLSFHSK